MSTGSPFRHRGGKKGSGCAFYIFAGIILAVVLIILGGGIR